jgi:hypothetical protein
MKRRISKFSERDHVMFKFLPDGEVFLWRGNRWVKKTSAVMSAAARAPIATAWPLSFPNRTDRREHFDAVDIPARTRVIVTRASGLARMVLHASMRHESRDD